MELTAENYYDNATSFDYMSTSLYKDFRKCEAFALAKLNGVHARHGSYRSSRRKLRAQLL